MVLSDKLGDSGLAFRNYHTSMNCLKQNCQCFQDCLWAWIFSYLVANKGALFWRVLVFSPLMDCIVLGHSYSHCPVVAIWCSDPLPLGWQFCSMIKLPGTEGSFWYSWFLYSDVELPFYEEETADTQEFSACSACVDYYFMGSSCVEGTCQHLGSVNQEFDFYSLEPG